MSEEILINVTPRETRVALVENGVLQEVFIERTRKRGIVGNIYKGKVSRVLPGMQAAFIDIGLDRAAFLHASDISSALLAPDDTSDEVRHSDIAELVTEGQGILVQVIKDPLGTKGARLTTHITIPSRYLVLLPGESTIGISTKIEDEDERSRLKEAVSGLANLAEGNGYIIRTVADGIDEQSLVADQHFLSKLWVSIQEKIKTARSGSVVYQDLPLACSGLCLRTRHSFPIRDRSTP